MTFLCGVSVALLVVAVRFWWKADRNWQTAELNKEIAVIRQIAARAESVRRNDWALLLATTAFDKAKQLGQRGHPEHVYPEVRCALLSALNRSPRLDRYVFTGRGKVPVLVVALSPNGRLLATVTPFGRIEGGGQGRGGHGPRRHPPLACRRPGLRGAETPGGAQRTPGAGVQPGLQP